MAEPAPGAATGAGVAAEAVVAGVVGRAGAGAFAPAVETGRLGAAAGAGAGAAMR